jgi:hypothetical protein
MPGPQGLGCVAIAEFFYRQDGNILNFEHRAVRRHGESRILLDGNRAVSFE